MRHLALGITWVIEDGIEPGMLSLSASVPFAVEVGPVTLRLDLGGGPALYLASGMKELAASCRPVHGCFLEAELVTSGLAALAVARPAAMIDLGPVTVGPWVSHSLRFAGEAGRSGGLGPHGAGLRAEINF